MSDFLPFERLHEQCAIIWPKLANLRFSSSLSKRPEAFEGRIAGHVKESYTVHVEQRRLQRNQVHWFHSHGWHVAIVSEINDMGRIICSRIHHQEMDIGFHATTQPRANRIMSEGLLPSADVAGPESQDRCRVSAQHHIFVVASLKDIAKWIEDPLLLRSEKPDFGNYPIVVLRVDLRRARIKTFRDPHSDTGFALAQHFVRPKYISIEVTKPQPLTVSK